MIEDFPKNELEFDRRFRHEQDCLDYLFELRWPGGFVCPNCGHAAYWKRELVSMFGQVGGENKVDSLHGYAARLSAGPA